MRAQRPITSALNVRGLLMNLVKRKKVMTTKLQKLLNFLEEFIKEDFKAQTQSLLSDPRDELDPVTDALLVWCWQKDAENLLKELTE